MSMQDTDAGCYCTKAIYEDNDYICIITGRKCNISPIPNQFECRTFSNVNRKEKRKDGTV